MAVGAGCRAENHTPREHRAGQVPLGGRQRGWPPPGGQHGEGDRRHLVARADSRSSCRGDRRRTLSAANRAGVWRRDSGKARCSICPLAGAGDGLWRFQDGTSAEVWKGADDALSGRPVCRRNGRSGGRGAQPAGETYPYTGFSGRLRSSVARRGHRRSRYAVVVPGREVDRHRRHRRQGAGLFKVPVGGGAPVPLVRAGAQSGLVAGRKPDRVCRAAGRVCAAAGGAAGWQPGRRYPRFVSHPAAAVARVFCPTGRVSSTCGSDRRHELLAARCGPKKTRQLTRLSSPATINTFDITPDGSRIVFDRVRENADIRLIDLPK